jgi:transposase
VWTRSPSSKRGNAPTSISGSRPGWRNRRVHLHFTPTYGSWLNLVEVFFAIIERQALRRGDLASVAELVAAIGRFCEGWNQRCHPFTWSKDADQILAKGNAGNTTATSDH